MEDRQQLSPAWRQYAETARALGARLTTAALRPGRSSSCLDDLARRLQRELDQMMRQAFASLPGEGEIACAAGCDHCCRMLPVSVGPIDVFPIVHRLRDTHVADLALAERLAALAPRETALAPGSPPAGSVPPDALSPCPLLGGDGLCIVYSSRPLACRGCVSADASACIAMDDDRLVPRSNAHQLGAAGMAKGVRDALETLGLAGGLVDIRPALVLAVLDEEAEKRWMRGEDVFAGLS